MLFFYGSDLHIFAHRSVLMMIAIFLCEKLSKNR